MTAHELFWLLWGLGTGWAVHGVDWRGVWRDMTRPEPKMPRRKGTKSHWV